MLTTQIIKIWQDLSGSEQNPVADFCDRSNGISGSIII
jgi:hypothetical protein